MQVKLLKDVFLTGGNIKKAGSVQKAAVYESGVYLEYRTCCSKGRRQLTEDEYEVIGESTRSPEQPDSPSNGG